MKCYKRDINQSNTLIKMAWIYNGKQVDDSLLFIYFFTVTVLTLSPVIMLCVCMIHWCADHYSMFSNEEVGGNGNRSTEEVNCNLRQERVLRVLS
jgi:hypothetical protein